MKEKYFQRQVIKYLKAKGFYVLNVEGLINGTPDLIVCGNGMFYGIELKVGNYHMTPIQELHQKHINKNGGIAFELRHSRDWKKELERKLYETR